MGLVIEIPCPECDRTLKVPESAFGKKLKCKYCGAKIEVEQVDLDELDDDDEDERPRKKKAKKPKDDEDEKPAVKPSKPGGAARPKKEEPKAEQPAAAPTYKFEDDDDDSAKPNPLGVVDEGQDIARCPHCAKELEPPDAVVCIHCGFNNVTRTKADSKKVWAPSTEDYVQHLGPGVVALLLCIGLIVLDIICLLNMRDWLTGTFLEKDDKDAQGEIAFYVKPGAFITFIWAATLMPIIYSARFAIKRLFIDNQPRENIKK